MRAGERIRNVVFYTTFLITHIKLNEMDCDVANRLTATLSLLINTNIKGASPACFATSVLTSGRTKC
jgi:hypothetical protein